MIKTENFIRLKGKISQTFQWLITQPMIQILLSWGEKRKTRTASEAAASSPAESKLSNFAPQPGVGVCDSYQDKLAGCSGKRDENRAAF